MNTFKILSFLIAISAFFACSDKDNAAHKVESIKILDLVNDTLKIDKLGDVYRINVDASPTKSELRYFTSNADVFTIGLESGVITPMGGGIAELIIVGPNGETWTKTTCVVKVVEYVEQIDVKNDKIIIIGDGQELLISSFFTPLPATAANRNLKYILSDENIATVDASGKVTAKNKGVVKITAIPEDDRFHVTSEELIVYSCYNENKISKEGWSATAFDTYRSNPNYMPDQVLNETTRYWRPTSNLAYPQWLLIDLGKIINFDQIGIKQPPGWALCKNVEIHVSKSDVDDLSNNDSSFEKYATISVEKNTIEIRHLIFPDILNARYIKLVFLDAYSVYLAISEFNLFTTN